MLNGKQVLAAARAAAEGEEPGVDLTTPEALEAADRMAAEAEALLDRADEIYAAQGMVRRPR